MEDYIYVLDNLPQGRSEDRSFHKTHIVLGIGENEFALLECVPKQNAIITIGDRVYVGKDIEKRDKILTIKRRISYNDLTNSAKTELPYTLQTIVKANEKKYVDFFNNADSINSRMHTLELLPGLGNKTMWTVLEERKKEKFKSFEDLTSRVKTLHHPEKMIAERIEKELSGDEKYHLFVRK